MIETCPNCGEPSSELDHFSWGGGYRYCPECRRDFERIREEGVVVQGRQGMSAADEGLIKKYAITLRGDEDDLREADSQVEALSVAKDLMDEYDLPGLFIYPPSGSVWHLEDYLETHPEVAEDVSQHSAGLLSRLFG